MVISWMQRHKKWLIVTIWVSTIAFVGAGFVGWGSYNYGKSNGTVAIVGDKEIPLSDLQNEYSALYSQYQNMFGGKFTQELAKKMGLEQAALQRVIEKYLLLNYADELGLLTTDEEVAKELVKIKAFFKDGKFDKNTYLSVLKQNRKSVADFEEELKKDLLVAKVGKIFKTKIAKNELNNISTLLFAQDKVQIKILDGKSIVIAPKLDELKAYYEKNKHNYKSPKGYIISYTKIAQIKDKEQKEMKKIALRAYLDLKKGKKEFEKTITLYENSDFLPKKELEKIIKSKDKKVLKPIYYDNSFIIVKKDKSIKPQVLAFEKVKQQLSKDYVVAQKAKILDQKAKKLTKNFTDGEDIGYVSRGTALKVASLDPQQNATLQKHILESTKPINFINVGGDKIVVYKIITTQFKPYDTLNDTIVQSTISEYKNGAISKKLLEKLQTRYTIKTYLAE